MIDFENRIISEDVIMCEGCYQKEAHYILHISKTNKPKLCYRCIAELSWDIQKHKITDLKGNPQ